MNHNREVGIVKSILSRLLPSLVATMALALTAMPAQAQTSTGADQIAPTDGGVVTPQQRHCPPEEPDCSPYPTNMAPQISWLQAPISGHYYLPTDSILLRASASDPDGSVVKVKFAVDHSSWPIDTSSPYETRLTGLSAGSHNVLAIAYDNEGRTAQTSTVTFYIRNSVVKGYVDSVSSHGLIKGWACSSYLHQSIHVDVYVGGPVGSGTLLGRYLANQSSSSAVDQACDVSGGSYRYSVQLSRSRRKQYAGERIYVYGISPIGAPNNALTQSGNFVVPSPEPPTIEWSLVPYNGSYFLPTETIPLHVYAGSQYGDLAKVQFVLDGHVYSTDASYPYQANLSDLSAGTHSVYARAVDDLGTTASTGSVTINIRNSVVKGHIDGVSSHGLISGWACSTYLPQSIDVDVYIGGPAGSGTGLGRYSANKNSNSSIDNECNVSGGSYRFQVQLTGSQRQQYANEKVYVYGISPIGASNNGLTNSGDFAVPPPQPPTIAWSTVPSSGQYFLVTDTISVGVTASSPDGSVAKVQFVLDGHVQSTDTSSPYAAQFSDLAAGAHTVYAKAVDELGLSTSTGTVTFNIRDSIVKGYIDGVSASDNIVGWACTTYLPQSIYVDVYAGGPAGSGTKLGRYLANESSGSDIASACNVSGGSYRFSITLTHDQRMQYANQPIYMYGISAYGPNNQLDRSGTFVVPPNPPDVASSASVDYDELGRVIAVRDSAGHVKLSYQYDANGNVTKLTDALGHVSTMIYDALNRVSQVTDALGHVTSYSYDDGNRVTQVIDPRGNATTYLYDGFGQLWQRTSPDTGTTTWVYATDGRLEGMTRADNVLVTYSYDALNRPMTINAGGQLRHMAYDACTHGIGRLCSASDATGTTSYAYTAEGQVAQRTFTMGATSYALGYTYDGSGRLATLTYPDGNQVIYHYQNGLTASVTATVDDVTQTIASAISYRPGDRLLQSWTAGNGLTDSFSYDGDGRLTSIRVPGVQSLTFSYDAAGRITRIGNGVNAALTQDFTYDALSRLTGVTSASGNWSYQYDANGNRTETTLNGATTISVIEASSNRLVSVGGQTIGYDANGNTVSKGGVTTYHYDAFNRLASAGGMDYYVSPEGQRLRKSGALGTTYFAPDKGGNLLAEHPASGWIDYVWLNGRVIGGLSDGQVYAAHSDQLGRPEAVTDASGSVVWQARNFAFGRTVSTGSITVNLGFPGQYHDAETGLWHNGFRDYDASLGRYIESDPIGLKGGINTYTYVTSNPVSSVDLLGLCPEQHQYNITEYTLCSATNAFSMLKAPNMSAPGAPRAEEGFTPSITLWGNSSKNKISQYVNSSTKTLINTTLPGHQFYPGTVTYQVTPGPFGVGSIISITGTGVGPSPLYNDAVGYVYFGSVATLIALICFQTGGAQ